MDEVDQLITLQINSLKTHNIKFERLNDPLAAGQVGRHFPHTICH